MLGVRAIFGGFHARHIQFDPAWDCRRFDRVSARFLHRAPAGRRASNGSSRRQMGSLHHCHPVRRDPLGRRGLLAQILGRIGRPADIGQGASVRDQCDRRLPSRRLNRRRADQIHQRLSLAANLRAAGDRDHLDRRRHAHSFPGTHRTQTALSRWRPSAVLQGAADRVLPVPRDHAGCIAVGRHDPGRRIARRGAQGRCGLHFLSRCAHDVRRDGVRDLQEMVADVGHGRTPTSPSASSFRSL